MRATRSAAPLRRAATPSWSWSAPRGAATTLPPCCCSSASSPYYSGFQTLWTASLAVTAPRAPVLYREHVADDVAWLLRWKKEPATTTVVRFLPRVDRAAAVDERGGRVGSTEESGSVQI